VSIFLGDDARKDRLCDSRAIEDAEYIHLACHGAAGRRPYLEGALFLARAEADGPASSVLTTPEVMALRTGARLVVMSACESGAGRLTRGEGVQGMVRGWLFAGARSVVATCWEVEDDATAELMEGLYRAALSSPISLTDAMAQVKRDAIADDRLACPAFWAAFTVYGGREGEPRPLTGAGPGSGPNAPPGPSSTRGVAGLGPDERAALTACGRLWEASWQTDSADVFRAFYRAATHLAAVGRAAEAPARGPTGVALGLVAGNCRAAMEHWARAGRPALAVGAYQAYVAWEPAARAEGWDALASAYQRDNLRAVWELARRNLLAREIEIDVGASLDMSITTSVARAAPEDACPGTAGPLEIALPISDPEFTSDPPATSYCRELGWVVFTLPPGARFRIVEHRRGAVHAPEENTYVVGGTWGSRQFSHTLSIRLHPDFMPLRFQHELIGGTGSVVTVRFTPGGAVVALRSAGGPWLERIALLFRRAPGASAMLGASGSPFAEEIDFGHFESLMTVARERLSGDEFTPE
jgi:hypothetical protein